MKNYLDKRNNRYGFWDDAFSNFFNAGSRNDISEMKTDVKENDKEYSLEIEMPGFDKKEIGISLEDGYLTVSAQKTETEEEDKKQYVRRERSVSMQRSFYVGDIEETECKAKYEDGILTVSVPKESKKELPTHTIAIE